jgi:hypothetical protein
MARKVKKSHLSWVFEELIQVLQQNRARHDIIACSNRCRQGLAVEIRRAIMVSSERTLDAFSVADASVKLAKRILVDTDTKSPSHE